MENLQNISRLQGVQGEVVVREEKQDGLLLEDEVLKPSKAPTMPNESILGHLPELVKNRLRKSRVLLVLRILDAAAHEGEVDHLLPVPEGLGFLRLFFVARRHLLDKTNQEALHDVGLN